MSTESPLSRQDLEWQLTIRHAVDGMLAAGRPRILVRNQLLQELRVRLRADYLFWGCGVGDPRTHTGITGEFRDDCDDSLAFDEPSSAEDKANSLHARCAWVAHTLNVAPPTNRLISDIVRSAEGPHVTCDVHGLANRASWRTKISMLMRPDLMLRARAAGLDQFMLTMRRFGENATFGIGYHRARRRNPATGETIPTKPFSASEIAFADAFSRRFDDILYRPRVDIGFLERICRDQILSHWERVAFPLLCSERYDEDDIAIILRIKPGRVSRLRRDICRKLGLETERRRSLQNLFVAWGIEPAWADLGRSPPPGHPATDHHPSWEAGFGETYEEPSLRERARQSPTTRPPES